jgi:hypothetical protein
LSRPHRSMEYQLFGFQNSDFVARRQSQNCVWQSGHILNAADVFSSFDLALEGQLFFSC